VASASGSLDDSTPTLASSARASCGRAGPTLVAVSVELKPLLIGALEAAVVLDAVDSLNRSDSHAATLEIKTKTAR
jgi:hypothetical protein